MDLVGCAAGIHADSDELATFLGVDNPSQKNTEGHYGEPVGTTSGDAGVVADDEEEEEVDAVSTELHHSLMPLLKSDKPF